MTTYTYNAYGLNFASQFPLPELNLCGNGDQGAPVISIHYGKVPETLPFASDYGIAWQSEPGKFLLTVDEVARYLILENEQVIVEPLNDSSEMDVRAFLLGSVLGALLHARRILVLHASVIQTERGAVLFTGNSGAGKSTLLAAFLKRRYAMLADDKAGIVVDENKIARAIPGFPRVRLTENAVGKLQFPAQDADYNRELGKYVSPVENFCRETLPVKAAYALGVHNRPEVILKPLAPFEQFEVLNYNTYRRRFLLEIGQRRAHFDNLSALSKQIRVSKVSRPEFPVLIDELVARIEEDIAR